ncbi:MAG: flagellar export protein FliJ [Deltaproteobacteria bacterium GWA2_54_12]|nr:MAG: flagellar export protein FliJ [Deltaproteobacteria bacterium GWA2_54_12]
MSKFVFNLEPLYDYRQRLEELSQKEFAEVNLHLAAEEKRLSEMNELYANSALEMDALKEKGAAVSDIEMQHLYLEGLKRHIKAQEEAVGQLRNLVEKKRAELIDAARNRRVIEIMKERSLNAHNLKENKLEQKEADDLTSARLRRKGNEN